jgi:glycosyltransferase involved in cell wall biosynthesis
VTVIIPTYNWSTVLPYSIGSVLRQTEHRWELLVVGDACTDDSAAIVQRVGDPRVRWINLDRHTGHQCGPNTEGVAQARGDVIAYLGHDDLWLPHHLALLVSAIDAGAGLAYGITARVSPGDSDVEPAPQGLEPYRSGIWIPPTAVVHRRDALERAGGWPHPHRVSRAPEAELWARMAATGVAVAFVPRLTAVKFPAGQRPGVYRTRPSHEQAAWFDRIGREPDIEAAELARMLRLALSPRRFVRRQLSRVRARARRAFGYGRVFDRLRRRKGLDPLR